MQTSRKLILHIGSHKTGSTTLQRTLYANRTQLGEQGWSLFCSAPDGKINRRGNANAWINDRVAGGTVRDGLAEQLGSVAGNVVASSEGFSWLFTQQAVGKLGAGLNRLFSRVHIVVYIKRQDLMAMSHYQQASKNKPALRFYVPGNRALPPYRSNYQDLLNYNQRLSLWAEAFGEQNLSIRICDRELLKGGDVVDDFSFVTGLVLPERIPWRNVSNGFEKTKVAHLMTKVKMPGYLRRRIEAVLDNTGKLMPSAAQARQFYDHFRDSNKVLNARFGISGAEYLFNEDFGMYPETAQDVWTEDSANQAIGNILLAVKRMKYRSAEDAITLRKCGETLEQKEPELARWLLDLAAVTDKTGM